ncbi:MAG: ABC transporter permease [Candidatus Hydrogenedentes bacterium]|nr:ABC transporter permease [Candidatus Hydrogenedentota bacterium]
MFALIRQEFIRHLRGARLFVWSFIFVTVSCVIVGGLWPSPSAHTSQIGVASRSMLELLSALLAAAAALIIPAYGAATISLERERETYDQLRLTLIRPAAIVVGKLISILGLFSVIAVSGLPIAATTYFLLGLDMDVLGHLGLMAFAVAFSSAGVGILCSTVSRRMIIAQTITFLLVFAILLASTLLLSIAVAPLSSVFMNSILYEFMPARVFQTVVGGLLTNREVFAFALFHAMIGSIALTCAAILLAVDRRLDRAMDPATPVLVAYLKGALLKPGVFRPIPSLLNPVMVREARCGELMTWRWQVRLSILASVILAAGLFSSAAITPGQPPPAPVWIAIQMVLVLFLVPGMTASTIVQERAQRSFDFLLMSKMRPSSIFLGKVLGVLISMQGVLLPCLLSMILAPFIYPALGLRDLAIFATGFVSLCVWMFVCACASTYACAAIERPTAAFAASYALCVLLFGGFGTGLFALKFYGTGAAFLSPVLGFLEKAADAGTNPLDQFNGPWLWHVITHLVLGFLFIFLALRAVEPFAQSSRKRWQ